MGKITKPCTQCSKPFEATCGAARFCSDACHFTSLVKRTSSCWLWTGATDKDGYGTVKLRGRRAEKAHRLSYRLTHGDIEAGKMVCHRCDNPKCCNPDHLFLGSAKDNKADCVAKGRHVKGEGLYWKAKLTENDVRAIRGDSRTSYEVADQYGVSAVLIQQIRKRNVWKHI